MTFTRLVDGLVPAPGGNGTTRFLREDGGWQVPVGGGAGLTWFNVLDHGIVADGTTDNRIAFSTMLATVLAAGGGTIYFPKGTYHMGVPSSGSRTCFTLTNKGAMNLVMTGDGPASIITWGGDCGGADAHLFSLEDRCSHLTVRDLSIRQKNALVNPDPAEQHHLFRMSSNNRGDVEHINFVRVNFGVCKGDAINGVGGVNPSNCRAGFLATAPAGTIDGPFTNPEYAPQRVCVAYPQFWDGGSITITGTDRNGNMISETVAALANPADDDGDRYFTEQEFATVTSASKSATGVNAVVATLGYVYMIQHINIDQCIFDGFVHAGTSPGYGYRSALCPQRMSRYWRVTGNYLTGSSDQLLDMEPTGNGNCGPHYLDGNTWIAADPNPSHSVSRAITLSGNGNSTIGGSLQNDDTIFSRNIVIGRIHAVKLKRVKIINNTIIADNVPVGSTSLLGLSQLAEDIEVSDNVLIGRPSLAGKLITISEGSSNAARGVRCNRNVLYWHGAGTAITVNAVENVEIDGNRIIHMGSKTDTYDAILVQPLAGIATFRNIRISSNHVEGNRGGGSVRFMVNFAIGATASVHGLTITNNTGFGIATRGISISKATLPAAYATFPVVHSNTSDATTRVFTGAGVIVAVGGNQGDVMLLRGTGSPEGAVIAPIGSQYLRTDGGAGTSFYVKEVGTGNTGWAAK